MDPGLMTLVHSSHILDLACDEISPETKAERERVMRGLVAEFPDCFAELKELSTYFEFQAKDTAGKLRRADRPPESTTCAEFPSRIQRVREAALGSRPR